MIIQVKSSYSDMSSYSLEDNQELYICHAPEKLVHEKYVYIQKEADEFAMARMYLKNGIVHLAPFSVLPLEFKPKGTILLQNKPFVIDTKLADKNVLQISECILQFTVINQTMTIMIGLVSGYKHTVPKRIIKVTPEVAAIPSTLNKIDVSLPLQQKGEQHHSIEQHAKEDEKKDDTPIKSDVSQQSEGKKQPKSHGVLIVIAVCMALFLCLTIWFIFWQKPAEQLPVSQTTVDKKQSEQIANFPVSEEENGNMISDRAETETKSEVGSVVAQEEDKQTEDAPLTHAGKDFQATEEQLGNTSQGNDQKSGKTADGSNVISGKSLPEKDVEDDELTLAQNTYATRSQDFEKNLNKRLDNNHVYLQLWQVFREMRPSDKNWKTAEDYYNGCKIYDTLEQDLVLAIKITALRQKNENIVNNQLLDEMRKRIDEQKEIMLESAHRAKIESDWNMQGIDKEYESLTKMIENAITEVTSLDAETSRIIEAGRKGRHLELIHADTQGMKEKLETCNSVLREWGKDIIEIHAFDRLLKNGLEIRRQSEKLTSFYNSMNAGETVDFKMINDAYQLLTSGYEEIKKIAGLPPEVWKILAERRDVEEKYFKEAQEVFNVRP